MPYQADLETPEERAAREQQERDNMYRGRREEGSHAGEGNIADVDAALEGVPIIGGGSSARAAAARNRRDQLEAQRQWNILGEQAPSWVDLAPQYREGVTDEYGNLIGDPSAYNSMDPEGRRGQHLSMQALQNLMANGGYTSADRAASQAMRAQQAQALGSANQAALQQAQARGMGASGAELGLRMQGGEAANYANSQADAGLQMAAMQRMLAATQGAGQLGTAMHGQAMERAGALDRFNQANMDWRRGRETRNTGWANQEGEARQRAYENAERRTAGMTGQYQASQGNRRADLAQQQQAEQAQASLWAGLLENI